MAISTVSGVERQETGSDTTSHGRLRFFLETLFFSFLAHLISTYWPKELLPVAPHFRCLFLHLYNSTLEKQIPKGTKTKLQVYLALHLAFSCRT